MFHTYIVTQTHILVDFDRASFLMDRELLKESIAARDYERDHCPRWDCVAYDAQWVWEYYCERHLEKYDEYFGPDVIPNWDQPAKLLPEKPIDLGPQPERFVRVLVGGRKPPP